MKITAVLAAVAAATPVWGLLPGCHPAWTHGGQYSLDSQVSAVRATKDPITDDITTITKNFKCSSGSESSLSLCPVIDPSDDIHHFTAWSDVGECDPTVPALEIGEEGGGCPDAWAEGSYEMGELAEVGGVVYKCTSVVFLNTFCGNPSFKPGQDSGHWKFVWKQLYENCEGTMPPTSAPNYETLEEVGGCPEQYIGGEMYGEGDTVTVGELVYVCKPWPSSTFCQLENYLPGSIHSDLAWELLGHCDGTISPTTSPVFVSLIDHNGCPETYNTAQSYRANDKVSVPIDDSNSAVYKCSQDVHKSRFCSVFAPGDKKLGWTLVAYCHGTMSPTMSPNFQELTEIGSGCPREYDASIIYEPGDQVSVVSSDTPDNAVVYECKHDWPHYVYCNAGILFAPVNSNNWSMGWVRKGWCSGMLAPSNSPVQYPEHKCRYTNEANSVTVYGWSESKLSSYKEGSLVRVGLDVYECQDWPNSLWCKLAAYQPGKGTAWETAWVKTGIRCNDPFAPTTAPTPTPVVSITIPASLALENFVPPTSQEEYDAIKTVLENTLQQTVVSFLIEGQTLVSIVVTSISWPGARQLRSLEATGVYYEMELQQEAAASTNTDDVASSLYNQVTTQITSNVESGDFVTTLKTNAEADASVSSLLSNIVVQTPTFQEYTIKTQSPTEMPTALATESGVKFVKISLPYNAYELNKAVMITELQVFDTSSNNKALASEGAVASQSSTYEWSTGVFCPASIAIDGSTAEVGGTLCHGLAHSGMEPQPWLMVELASPVYDIDRVVIWNRMECCSGVLSNAVVTLLNQHSTKMYTEELGDTTNVNVIQIDIEDFAGMPSSQPSLSSSPSSQPSLSSSPSSSISPSVLPFTLVGLGNCVGTSLSGGFFSYLSGSGDSFAACAGWCSQNINSKFVGFHRVPDLKQCGCLFADGAAQDVELTAYDPDSTQLTMGHLSPGPIIRSDWTPGVECYSYDYFLTAQPSEMASDVPSSQPSVSCVKRGDDPLRGETISKDHNSHRYEVSLATNGEFSQYFGDTEVLIGTLDQIVDNKATFAGGDHCFGDVYRSGQVALIEDCDKGYLEVTSISEPSTCYYTMDITGICYCPPFTKVGDGYCRGAGNTVFSYHYRHNVLSRSACFDWCSQVITDDFVGIEYNPATNYYCRCLFSDGTANDFGRDKYDPWSSGSSANGARGPIVSVYEYDDMECYSYDEYVAPTLSPTSSTWPSPDVTKVGDGVCRDGANKSFGNRKISGHATSSPVCYVWCSQAIIDEFVGFNFYDISGTKWCSCLFDYGGGLKVSSGNYTPNSLSYEGGFGRGPIVSVLERDGWECYSYKNYTPPTLPPSQSPSFSPSSLPSTSPSQRPSISLDPTFTPTLSPTGVKFVKITLPYTEDNTTLMITELQVFDMSSNNLALASEGAIASQSSTYMWDASTSCPASIAIDGSTDEIDDIRCDGLAHSGIEPQPWLMVELASSYEVDQIYRVVVWNRMSCCSGALSNAVITLMNEDSLIIRSEEVGDTTNTQAIYALITQPPPSSAPSLTPSNSPSEPPSLEPSESPSDSPTLMPSSQPSSSPSSLPSAAPSDSPSSKPSSTPSSLPSAAPSGFPSLSPSLMPSSLPSLNPSSSLLPTNQPSSSPSETGVKFVKISLPNNGQDKAVMITELQVFDTSSNNKALASEGAVASQSSTYEWSTGVFCPASIAIDGSTAEVGGTLCHGLAHSGMEPQPWLMVELASPVYDIDRVVIWNRMECCSGFLSNALISLISEDSATMYTEELGDTTNVNVIQIDIEDFAGMPSSQPSLYI